MLRSPDAILLLHPGNTRNDSTTFSAMFSRFSSFCWPYRASNKYLAGPIGPANDPLLALLGQLMIPCRSYRASNSKRSLAGPIGPARHLLMVRQGQQKLENLENVAENVVENVAESLRVFSVSTCWTNTVLSLRANTNVITY